MRAALASFEQHLARLAQLGFALVWPALYGASVGYAAWAVRHRSLLATLAKNKLAHEQRMQMAAWAGAGLSAVLILYLAILFVDRAAVGSFRLRAALAQGNRKLAGLLALPVGAALLNPGVESSDPISTVLLAAVAAVAVAFSAFHLGPDPVTDEPWEPAKASRLGRLAERLGPVATGLALVGLWAAYGYALSRLAVTNHHALNTRTIDLGYYDNVFYNSVHGRPLGCSFVKGGNHASAHFDPILVLLSPLYLLYPRAEFLLVLQSVWLGMGVVPAYLIGRTVLERRSAGFVMALAYALYPALHGANLYEFHSLTLTAPLVLWLFYFLETRRWFGYGVAVLALCLCREDLPLMLCLVGLHAVLTRRPGFARAGVITIAFAVGYYALARGVFMPSKDLLNSGTDKAYSYAYYFEELLPNKRGLGDVALTLLTNPMFVLRHAFTDLLKVQYLLVLFVPLGALPLLARNGRLIMAYGLLVCLLASRKPVFQVGFQYAAMIFPFAFAVTPRAILDVAEAAGRRSDGMAPARVTRALLAFILAASLLVSWKFGALVENAVFRGGFGKIARYQLTETQHAQYGQLRSLVDKIEPGASVLVTNRVGAHVSNRRDAYLMHQRKGTNYVLVEDSDLGKQRGWHDDRVKKGQLEVVEHAGPFTLYRAVTPPPAPPAPSASGSAAPATSPSLSAKPVEEPPAVEDEPPPAG
ncbi:MAG: DUF2079 domain-containing protein [Deltaproteobacteria bacterium]|nr:DUF2079 domain-containing protein [Deltaproteobacteria bacterium]